MAPQKLRGSESSRLFSVMQYQFFARFYSIHPLFGGPCILAPAPACVKARCYSLKHMVEWSIDSIAWLYKLLGAYGPPWWSPPCNLFSPSFQARVLSCGYRTNGSGSYPGRDGKKGIKNRPRFTVSQFHREEVLYSIANTPI